MQAAEREIPRDRARPTRVWRRWSMCCRARPAPPAAGSHHRASAFDLHDLGKRDHIRTRGGAGRRQATPCMPILSTRGRRTKCGNCSRAPAPIRLIDRKLLQSSDQRAARSAGQIGADRRLFRYALCRAIRGFVQHHFGRECRRCRDSDTDVRLSRASLSALAQSIDRCRRNRRHCSFHGDACGWYWHCGAGLCACRSYGNPCPRPLPRLCSTAGLRWRVHGNAYRPDILNLDKIGSLGARIASIGGAGTFDGIFLTGILAVLLAGLASPSRLRPAS
jgi:hypothetical protein